MFLNGFQKSLNELKGFHQVFNYFATAANFSNLISMESYYYCTTLGTYLIFFISTLFGRFGFIKDQRLPDNSRRSDEERKSLDKEMQRVKILLSHLLSPHHPCPPHLVNLYSQLILQVDKWLKMLKEQQKWFPRDSRYREKMVERTWKGVPERMRGSLWRILLDLDQIKAEQVRNSFLPLSCFYSAPPASDLLICTSYSRKGSTRR